MFFNLEARATRLVFVAMLMAIVMMPGNSVLGQESGYLWVVESQPTPPTATVGEVCFPAGAVLQNSEVEPAVVSNVVVLVEGNFAAGDLESLGVGIGDSGVVRIGPVEPGGIYQFAGNWYFDKNEVQELKISIFVKGGVGKEFRVLVTFISAIGQFSGLEIPVFGFPFGGMFMTKIVSQEPTGSAELTLVPEAETAVVGELFTVNAIVENTGELLPRSAITLFFIGADKSVLKFVKVIPSIPEDGIWGGKLADIQITEEMALIEDFWLIGVLGIKQQILDIKAMKILIVNKPEPPEPPQPQ